MPLQIWLVTLLFSQANAEDDTCDKGFIYHKSADICLTIPAIQDTIRNAAGVCQKADTRSRPFEGRMDDELFEEFERNWVKVNSYVNKMFAYVGMTKGLEGSKWTYNHNEGDVEEGDFPYWSAEPDNDDCGIMEVSKECKITPTPCVQKAPAICARTTRKDEPCYNDLMIYAEYYGHCLAVTPDKDPYKNAEQDCMGGYVFPVKDDKTFKSAAALLNTYPGPVYAGLKKLRGTWMYEKTGEDEEDRFAEGSPGNAECGALGITSDYKVKFFTADCKGKFRFICEMKCK